MKLTGLRERLRTPFYDTCLTTPRNWRSAMELALIEESLATKPLVPLGWCNERWWFVGALQDWLPPTDWRMVRANASAYPPDWAKGYACWHYPVGWITATHESDMTPWRDNARLKRIAEELTEQAIADQVANALTKLNENLGYGGVWGPPRT